MSDRLTITTEVLRVRRRSLLLWAVALAVLTATYGAFYPLVGGDELASMTADLPDALATAFGYQDLGSGAGYLTSTVFGLLAPILLAVFAIGAGARLVAGEEEDGTLELELTHPVGRRRVVAERLLALVVQVAALSVALAVVTLALAAVVDLGDVTVGGVLAACLGLALLVIAFGTVALAIGAATGRRAVALGAAAGLAVVAYAGRALGGLSTSTAWLVDASPFEWFLGGDPMRAGIDVGGYLALAGLAVVAAGVGIVAIGRRDLRV